MKKRILALFMVLTLVFCFTGCGENAEALGDLLNRISEAKDSGQDDDDYNEDEEDYSEDTGTEDSVNIRTSDKTDVWPAGVYDALGVPEYTEGEIVYAYPNDEEGHVFINTTREELIAYVDELLAQGFHMADYNYENLQSHSWESFNLYFPEAGGEYSLYCYYSWENDGTGSSELIWDENSGEEFEIHYNVMMDLYRHGYPQGWNCEGGLESVGISDDKLKIENADKIVESVESISYGMDMVYVGMGIDFAFDYNLTPDFWRPFQSKLAQACADAADDGKIVDYSGEAIDISAVAEEGLSGWLYTYDGKLLMVQVFCESGYGEAITIMIQQMEN